MKALIIGSEPIILNALDKVKDLKFLEDNIKSKCIYTKGVFDVLHFGHMALFYYLHELKTVFDLPVVISVASDKVVKEKKGNNRPINSEMNRIKQIALLPQVDFVHLQDETDYSNVVMSLKPSIYVKGMDTAGLTTDINMNNVEVKEMDIGAKFIIFTDNNEISTSTLINKIKHTFK